MQKLTKTKPKPRQIKQTKAKTTTIIAAKLRAGLTTLSGPTRAPPYGKQGLSAPADLSSFGERLLLE